VTRGVRLSRWALSLGVLLAACGDKPTLEPTPKGCPDCVPPGTVLTDAAGYIEYTTGDAPLIITAPHGGAMKPASLPDRDCAACITDADVNTEDLARRVVAEFYARTGRRPHLVINRLHRSKLDANREVVEATDGFALLTSAWSSYHMFIESARGRVSGSGTRGLLIDLHGHAHPVPRLELGYDISASTLRLGDAALASSSALAASSIARLLTANASGTTPAVLLRGATSLGAFFAANGFPAVPSPSDPAPAAGEAYYDGGYTVQRHGSALGGNVDAVQVEAFRVGARDTPENLTRFAGAIVTSSLEFLRLHYGWTPPAR
jgi:hypothetical protein